MVHSCKIRSTNIENLFLSIFAWYFHLHRNQTEIEKQLECKYGFMYFCHGTFFFGRHSEGQQWLKEIVSCLLVFESIQVYFNGVFTDIDK